MEKRLVMGKEGRCMKKKGDSLARCRSLVSASIHLTEC